MKKAIDFRSGLTKEQKHRAEQLTSIFENCSIEIKYSYAEKLPDGRGITAGRAGFTTATGDACYVVEIYTKRIPRNVLAPFLPRLRQLAAERSSSTQGLRGFEEAWANAAEDAIFRNVQDEVVDELYYQPSIQHSVALRLQTALARAVLYDSIIQHGDGDDLDGLPALLKRTLAVAGGSPSKIGEKEWLRAFLKVRRADLAHSYNPETRKVWAQSVGRCDVFSDIAASGNYYLKGPFGVNYCSQRFMIS